MIDDVVTAVERVTGRRVVARHEPPGTGYTPAIRFVAELDSGDRVFVKAPPDPHIGAWIQQEIEIYRSVDGPFMPGFIGARDATPGDSPVLVIEDLSRSRWPPPWDDGSVDAVVSALDRLHTGPVPDGVPPIEILHPSFPLDWDAVAVEPETLTGTGLCGEDWLAHVLPHFQRAARDAPLGGSSLCHLDVRSDNLCLVADGSARLIDWNHACRANPELDLACWIPSLAYETGLNPEELGIDVDPGLAAAVAGFLAARAGMPDIPKAPRVREVQRAQLSVALPWAARRCGFAAP